MSRAEKPGQGQSANANRCWAHRRPGGPTQFEFGGSPGQEAGGKAPKKAGETLQAIQQSACSRRPKLPWLLLLSGFPDGLLHRWTNVDDALVVPRDSALDEQQALLRVHLDHLEVLGRHLLDAILPGHLLIGIDAPWRFALADRAWMPPVFVRAVGLPKAGEAPALHHALKASAFGDAGHVDQLALGEKIHFYRIAHFELGGFVRAYPEFFHVAAKGSAGLLEGAHPGFGQGLFLDLAESQRERRVLVLFGGLLPDHCARRSVDDGDRDSAAVLAKDLCHSNFFTNQSVQSGCLRLWRTSETTMLRQDLGLTQGPERRGARNVPEKASKSSLLPQWRHLAPP